MKYMEEILSYYYEKFHSSLEYRRLSDYRKMNSEKGNFGWRIFSGYRQKQFLARMLPRVTEEGRKTLSKVLIIVIIKFLHYLYGKKIMFIIFKIAN